MFPIYVSSRLSESVFFVCLLLFLVVVVFVVVVLFCFVALTLCCILSCNIKKFAVKQFLHNN